MYKKYGKRSLDITLSLFFIVLFSPLYLILAILVRLKMGKPIFFKQRRIGKDEKCFDLLKFRSMTDSRDKDGNLLPEKERLTRFGTALRSSSLDELPELISILKGDMSFVGPRPLPVYYGPYFLSEERKRHRVKGGLIPPDSVSFQTTCDWETQFGYETEYADNVSLKKDVQIVLSTFVILIKRIKTNYGADDRPHLNVYRKDMPVPEQIIKEWENK